MSNEKQPLERICFNCSHFFVLSRGEPTEYGICLDDEEFDPYLDELLENMNFECCEELIERKKIVGEREGCEEYEECEYIEIDDDGPLGKLLANVKEGEQPDRESLEDAILEEKFRNIDWKSLPVDKYKEQLKSNDSQTVKDGIFTLSALSSQGNKKARETLFNYFVQIPSPQTIEDVHFKIEVFRELERSQNRESLIPYLISELYNIPSNNTTRQWISEIFQFLKRCPLETVQEQLETMLHDNRFSYKYKKKMKSILNQDEWGGIF